MPKRSSLFFASLALLAACGGEQERPAAPSPPAARPWKAEDLQGPFADVAAFCAKLGAPRCEARSDVVVSLADLSQPVAAADGSAVQLVTVASGDDEKQRIYLLLQRNGELFALPPLSEYTKSDGQSHEVTLRAFERNERSGLLVLVFAHETASGAGPAKRREARARQAVCRAARDFPVACALFDTERIVTTGDELAPVPDQTAEVLVTLGERGAVKLTAHARSGEEALKTLSAPGEYRLAFP